MRFHVQPQPLFAHQRVYFSQMFGFEWLPLRWRNLLDPFACAAVPQDIPPLGFIFEVVTELLGRHLYLPQPGIA
jgi:hypothetical protein